MELFPRTFLAFWQSQNNFQIFLPNIIIPSINAFGRPESTFWPSKSFAKLGQCGLIVCDYQLFKCLKLSSFLRSLPWWCLTLIMQFRVKILCYQVSAHSTIRNLKKRSELTNVFLYSIGIPLDYC